LTGARGSACIGGVKWLALFLFVALQCSCTTLVNRRDLYSPEPAPDAMPPVTKTTTTTTTTHMRGSANPREETPPEFR
jgi:hypothetical protein